MIVGRQWPLWPGMVTRDGKWIGLEYPCNFQLLRQGSPQSGEVQKCPGIRPVFLAKAIDVGKSHFCILEFIFKNYFPLLELFVCTRQAHTHTTIHVWRSEDTLRDSVFSPSITWAPMIELRSSVFVASSFAH